MSLLSEILQHNADFVGQRRYEPFRTTRFPDKKLVILTCMDTRLTELLPHAMNLRQGDAKIIKNAGALVSHPFGSVMRSILVAVYELSATEVAIVGHHDCGMASLSCERVLNTMRQRGIPPAVLATLEHSGIDLAQWLTGFTDVTDAVRSSVDIVKHHPLLPGNIPVHGLLIHPETGQLDLVADGYNQ